MRASLVWSAAVVAGPGWQRQCRLDPIAQRGTPITYHRSLSGFASTGPFYLPTQVQLLPWIVWFSSSAPRKSWTLAACRPRPPHRCAGAPLTTARLFLAHSLWPSEECRPNCKVDVARHGCCAVKRMSAAALSALSQPLPLFIRNPASPQLERARRLAAQYAAAALQSRPKLKLHLELDAPKVRDFAAAYCPNCL